jgi:hypothetical protein
VSHTLDPAYNRCKLNWNLQGETVQKYYSWALAALGGVTLSQAVLAQRQNDMVGLSIDGAVDVRSVENAGLQPDSEQSVSEVETITSLAANGRLEGSWAEFLTDYSVEDRRYSEFEEENERLILGDSVLTLGPQHRRYYLQLSHSSREVSIDPLVADRPENRDNRVFLSGVLYGSVNPGDGNTLGLWGGVTEIQFDESRENEATRYSVGTMFERAVSPVSRAGISATGYELEYQNLEDADLTYSRLALTWRTELRRLSYGLEIGGNRIETDTDTNTSPSFAADLAYRSGPQSVTLSFNQYLSDTSQGAQATSEAAPITNVEVDGRLAGIVDQFKLQQFAFTWAHTQVCAGCELRLNLGADQESYVTFPEFDSRELSAGLLLSYRATAAVVLSLRGDYRNFEEVNVEPSSGYDQVLTEFIVSFPRIIRDGQLDLFAGSEARDFDVGEGYDSSYAGIRFRYRFYER